MIKGTHIIIKMLEEGERIPTDGYELLMDEDPVEELTGYDVDYDFNVITVKQKNIYRVHGRLIAVEYHFHPFDGFGYQYDDMYFAIPVVKERIEYEKAPTAWQSDQGK